VRLIHGVGSGLRLSQHLDVQNDSIVQACRRWSR
jgi:hypothetical protein